MSNFDNHLLKWQTLASYFERDGAPNGDIELTIQANGIYSIPEEWLKLEACGSCDTWQWHVKLSDAHISDGKFNPREMSEEEKKELENKKKPKQTGKKELEPTKEEKERMLKEQQEKEEAELKKKEHFESLSDQEKFWYVKEDKYEEPWIGFTKNSNTVVKSGEKLILIEEDINEHEGLLLEVLKIPPQDEDPKKRPKPKGIPIEDVKPILCCCFINTSIFKTNPGETVYEVRAPLMLQETYDKEKDEEDYVLKAKTYAYIKISFNKPINPPLPEKGLPTPKDILKRDEKIYKPITPDEICQDFKKQLKIAIEAISKEYVNFVGDTRNQSNKKDKVNVVSGARNDERDTSISKFLFSFNMSKKADILKEKLKRFIVRIVREKFSKKENVKSVFKNEKDQFYSELFSYLCDEVKICMDQYVNQKRDELHEHILSSYQQSRKEVNLYANKITKETEDIRLVRLSKEYEIIENYDSALNYFKASLTLTKNKDSWLSFAVLNKKLGRLDDCEEAIVFSMNEILNQKESGQIKDNLAKSSSNATLKDLKIKSINQEMAIFLLYSSIKFVKGRSDDALNFMNRVISDVGIKNTGAMFNALLAMFYKEKNNMLLFDKHKQTFDRFLLREKGKIPLATSKKPFKQSLISNHISNEEMILLREEAIYIYIDDFFNYFHFYEITKRLLDCFIEYKHTNKYLLSLAKIKYYENNFQDVISLTSDILKKEVSSKLISQNQMASKTHEEKEKDDKKKDKNKKSIEEVHEVDTIPPDTIFPIVLSEVYTLRGNAYYMQENLFNSAEDYVKAIRKKQKNQEYDIKMLYRLGYTFIKRSTWEDAKTVFLEILKENQNYSFAWRYLGLSLMRLKNYKSSEEALSEANLLDIENSENWGFLTLYCLKDEKKYQAIECVNELFKTNYSNVDILFEIADTFKDYKEYRISADVFKRILEINPGNAKSSIGLAELYNKQDRKHDAEVILMRAIEFNENENQRIALQHIIDELNGKSINYQEMAKASESDSKKEEDVHEMESGLKENYDDEEYEDGY